MLRGRLPSQPSSFRFVAARAVHPVGVRALAPAARAVPTVGVPSLALAVVLVPVACGGAPTPTVPSAAAVADVTAPTSLTAAKAPPATASPAQPSDTLRARLAPILERLTTPPFGSAASITAVTATATATVTTGTLHDGGPPATDRTRFSVASVSKVLTASRVVALAHEGALRLDDRLQRHLPGVRLVDPEGRDRTRDVTVRHLLTHRAGLPHVPTDVEAKVAGRWGEPRLLTDLTKDWTIRLASAPGGDRYSNLGYVLLAAIVERHGDCSFADCMQPHLEALGMVRSTFGPPSADGDAAHGHVRRAGSLQVHPPGWYTSRYGLPFTGLWTTTTDLAHFGGHLAAAASDSSAQLHPMTIGEGRAVGPVVSERLGARSLEHDGSGPGFYAALVVVPEREVVVALATNGGAEARAEIEAFSAIVGDAVAATAAAGSVSRVSGEASAAAPP